MCKYYYTNIDIDIDRYIIVNRIIVIHNIYACFIVFTCDSVIELDEEKNNFVINRLVKMDDSVVDKMTINELLAECDAIFNSLDSSSISSTTTLSTSSSSSTKDKLFTIHKIMKRNETLMEELKTVIEDSKYNLIVKEINCNQSEIARIYQEFDHISIS